MSCSCITYLYVLLSHTCSYHKQKTQLMSNIVDLNLPTRSQLTSRAPGTTGVDPLHNCVIQAKAAANCVFGLFGPKSKRQISHCTPKILLLLTRLIPLRKSVAHVKTCDLTSVLHIHGNNFITHIIQQILLWKKMTISLK